MIVIRKDMYIMIVVCATLLGFIVGVLTTIDGYDAAPSRSNVPGFHLRSHPTADQLYGCTLKQQDPNGECK